MVSSSEVYSNAAKTMRASATSPCRVSQRGDSGRKTTKPKTMRGIKIGNADGMRHDRFRRVNDIPKSKSCARAHPVPVKMPWVATCEPREAAGEISDCHIGIVANSLPVPMPTMTRDTTSCAREHAVAARTAPTIWTSDAAIITRRRPSRSPNQMQAKVPRKPPTAYAATTVPWMVDAIEELSASSTSIARNCFSKLATLKTPPREEAL